MRCEHLLQHADGDPRLVAQLRHPAGARIQLGSLAGFVDQRIPAAVDIADPITEGAIAGSDAELLDPWVLVRRHRL
jgi:hypothetical protein